MDKIYHLNLSPFPLIIFFVEIYNDDRVRFPRGLFNGTTGVTKWATEDYLPTVFGNFTIPIVRNAVVGTLQDDRVVVSFESAFKEMYRSKSSKQYLFFPVKSRYTFNGSEAGSAEALHEACNVIAEKDLDLSRIWKGFGTKAHKTLVGSQFVIGKSVAPPSKDSTGSDWHCAIGNNWFVQVAGKKSWQFIGTLSQKWWHFVVFIISVIAYMQNPSTARI